MLGAVTRMPVNNNKFIPKSTILTILGWKNTKQYRRSCGPEALTSLRLYLVGRSQRIEFFWFLFWIYFTTLYWHSVTLCYGSNFGTLYLLILLNFWSKIYRSGIKSSSLFLWKLYIQKAWKSKVYHLYLVKEDNVKGNIPEDSKDPEECHVFGNGKLWKQ